MIYCAERKPGETCELCGATIGPVADYLPTICIDLEARHDRVSELFPQRRAVMELAGGTVAEAIERKRPIRSKLQLFRS